MSRHGAWLAAAALALAACSATASPTSDAPPAGEVRVGLDEYEVRVSHPRVLQDVITLEITNVGRTAHDLRVDGGAEAVTVDPLRPGATATLQVDAANATELILWCTLPGHEAQGMTTTLTVDHQAGD